MKAQLYPTEQSDPFKVVVRHTFRLIKQSWRAVSTNLGTILLIYILPSALILALLYAIAPDLLKASIHPDHQKIAFAKNLNVPLAIIGGLGIAILVILLSIASVNVQLASARKQKISFSDVIERSWPFFLRFVGLGILSALCVLLGLLLLLIPGILAAFFLSFATYVMVDKNVGVIVAMKGSYKLTRRNWKVVLAYFVVTVAISLPQIVPIIGEFVSAGLSIAYFCLPAILYLRMQKSTK
jgi:uncharacterized membrane protein